MRQLCSYLPSRPSSVSGVTGTPARRVERLLFAVVRGWDDPKAGPHRFGIRALRRVPRSQPPGQLHTLVLVALTHGTVG